MFLNLSMQVHYDSTTTFRNLSTHQETWCFGLPSLFGSRARLMTGHAGRWNKKVILGEEGLFHHSGSSVVVLTGLVVGILWGSIQSLK